MTHMDYMEKSFETRDSMRKVVRVGGCASHLIKGARILSVSLDPENRAVTFDLVGCPDMSGGIVLAWFMMPGVAAVMFLEQGKPDMLYLKEKEGWSINCQRRRVSNDCR